MAKRTKTAVIETLSEFLFARIKGDTGYQEFRKGPLPQYITDNIHPAKPLRPYQEEAVKYFIWLYEHEGISACKHLLFNMATGAGKTLVMACCMLYLYECGYRKFIFLVHQVQILSQARRNFTEENFEKYLFHPDGMDFYGKQIGTRGRRG
jgi:type III restriction enzyme